jgi:tetratricopeptide (TPR) repeat protein
VPKSLLECRQLSSRGASAVQRHDLVEAEMLLAKAVETYNLDPEAHRQYAAVLWQRGARKEALAELDHAIELAGDDPVLLVRRAEWHLTLNNLPAAQADAEAALNADPNAATTWLLRARLLLHRGEAEEALAAYHRVLNLEPNQREALFEEAQLHWSLAVSDPQNFQPQLQRALMSVQALLDTYSPGEESAATLLLAGRIHTRLGRYDDATRMLASAARRGGDNWEVLHMLAEAQLLAGRTDEALVTAQQALALAPQNVASNDLVQRIHVAQAGRATAPAGFAGDAQALRR